MREANLWVYESYGGLSSFEAKMELSDRVRLPHKPEGVELKTDVEKEPFKPIWLGSIPKHHIIREPLMDPVMVRISTDDDISLRKVHIRYCVYETVVMGFSVWIQSRMDNSTTPPTSIGRWQDYRWYQWQQTN